MDLDQVLRINPGLALRYRDDAWCDGAYKIGLSVDLLRLMDVFGTRGRSLRECLERVAAEDAELGRDEVLDAVQQLVSLGGLVQAAAQPVEPAPAAQQPVVWSWNEWDPLEEVIVGIADGARVQYGAWDGEPFRYEVVAAIQAQLDNFAHILEAEGVKVRRPEPINLGHPVTTPYFSARGGYNVMNPRDLVMIVGDQIIETPAANRKRYFETFAYRELFKEYFRQGARWVSAPKPMLSDELYIREQVKKEYVIRPQQSLTEFEPVFDAADFVRCGRDLFGTLSIVTNRMGMDWLRRHLGEGFRVHEVETRCDNPEHIDTTFVPIGPGKVLVNPKWIGKLPEAIKNWDVLEAPEAEGTVSLWEGVKYATSPWIALNVFLLDQERIFVDDQQYKLIRMLKDWGLKPIPVPFNLCPVFGGAFHCVTLDVRRRGTLQSYC